jgi:ABC-type polysaccharide/polyol phosphate export permease
MTKFRRARLTALAFFDLGFSTARKYPLGFITQQIAVVVPVFIYYFIAGFFDQGAAVVGGDYFTFVILGVVGMSTLNAGLRALSNEIDIAVSRGWFEMILVEPVPWPMLPFGMGLWQVANATFAEWVVFGLGLLLGVQVTWVGLPLALAIGLLGVTSGLAIGSAAASVKVLAKQGDPVLTFYSLAASIFSGVYFPVSQLPSWLRPFSYVFPHTYVVTGLRRTLMPGGATVTGPGVGTVIAVLGIVAVVGVPSAIAVFSRAMQFGRRIGALSGY